MNTETPTAPATPRAPSLFTRAFAPGLIVGIVAGLFAGVFISPFLGRTHTSPRRPAPAALTSTATTHDALEQRRHAAASRPSP